MKEFINNISLWLDNTVNLGYSAQQKFLYSIIIIIILYIMKVIVNRTINKKAKLLKTRYRWRKSTAYISAFTGLFLVARIWLEGVESLATFLGLLSAGVAIALKDPITNMAGWAFILWKRPFEVGHRVQIGEYTGDVIDIRLFKFSILEVGNWVDADQSTGRIVDIPNYMVLSEVVANYCQGFPQIWHEIPILLTFESDWKKAKEILTNIANDNSEQLTAKAEKKIKEAAKKFMIFYKKLTPIVYTSVKDSGVLLTIRLLCEVRNRRTTEEKIWECILEEFSKHKDIDFAYPTTRFYNMPDEENKTE